MPLSRMFFLFTQIISEAKKENGSADKVSMKWGLNLGLLAAEGRARGNFLNQIN